MNKSTKKMIFRAIAMLVILYIAYKIYVNSLKQKIDDIIIKYTSPSGVSDIQNTATNVLAAVYN